MKLSAEKKFPLCIFFFKGNPHCYNKLTLSQKLNYLKNNWKYNFSVQKNVYEYRLFSLLDFPCAAILNIFDVIQLPNCYIQKNVDSKQ